MRSRAGENAALRLCTCKLIFGRLTTSYKRVNTGGSPLFLSEPIGSGGEQGLGGEQGEQNTAVVLHFS